MFVKENVNPKNRLVGDCVIRAIAKAEDKPWLEVFDTLTEIARATFNVPSDKKVYKQYLKKYDKIDVFKYVDGGKVSVVNGVKKIETKIKKRYTVDDVCKMKGTYIISIAHHLTVASNGKLYDTWDCGNRCTYIIWKVK